MNPVQNLKNAYHAMGQLLRNVRHAGDWQGRFVSVNFWKFLSTTFPTLFMRRYHRALMALLRKTLALPRPDALPAPAPAERMRVWVMWWQGRESMPPLVGATFDSIRRHARDLEVVLVTQDNWLRYVAPPHCVLEKINERKITFTTLSDYVRVSLLARYGGVWIDSTMLLAGDIPAQCLSDDFWTIKHVENVSDNVSRSRWNGQFLSSTKTHNPLFETMRILWEQYWQKVDSNIEYFMTDYLVALVYEGDPGVRAMVDGVAPSNERLYLLGEKLNAPFDAGEWEAMRDGTTMFKLSYKLRLDGAPGSYYAALLEGRLDE